jgi:hypothetical protein
MRLSECKGPGLTRHGRPHSILHRELRLPPWEWPAYEIPGEPCPYPAGTHAARHWADTRARRPEAFELYRALVEAARSAQLQKEPG